MSLFGNIIKGAGSILGGSADSQAAARGAQATAHEYQTLGIPGFGTVGVKGGIQNFNPMLNDLMSMSLQGAGLAYTDPNIAQGATTMTGLGNAHLPSAVDNAFNNSISFNPALQNYNSRLAGLFNTGLGMLGSSSGGGGGGGGYRANLQDIIDQVMKSGKWQNKTGRQLIKDSDFQSLADERLALLREQANPYNTMARNALSDELAAQGQNFSKAGAMRHGQLDLAQNTADIERQLQAQTMADQLRQFNIGAGHSLLQGGTSAYNAATGARSVEAQSAAAQANAAAQRMQASIAGRNQLFGFLGDMANAGLTGNIAGIGAENSRGQTRMYNAAQLLGFGQDLLGNRAQQMSDYMQPYSDIQSIIRNSYNTSAAPGGINNGRSAFVPTMSGSEQAMAGVGDIFGNLGEGIADLFGLGGKA